MRLASLSPSNLSHPDLPPGLVLAARVVALGLVLRGDSPFRVQLPLVEWLALADPTLLNLVTRGAAGLGCVLVLVGPFVRTGAALAGGAYLLGLLACRPCHSVAHTFVACLLIIIALSSRRSGTTLLRAQVVLLYAGAAFNKTIDADWWNGRYFETFLVTRHEHAFYGRLSAAFPDGWLSTGMGVLSVFVQWALAACFLRARTTPAGIVLAGLFHGGMMLLLNATFGPFVIALGAAYLGLAWPDDATSKRGAGSYRTYHGLVTNPVVALVATMFLASEAYGGLVRNAALVVLSMALLPLLRVPVEPNR